MSRRVHERKFMDISTEEILSNIERLLSIKERELSLKGTPMGMIYEAFGWQGGTIHQVIDEIKRLKAKEKCCEEMAKKSKNLLEAMGF